MDELLEGPVGGGILLAVDNEEYLVLLDDKLTSNEMDWLCGMYICSTGMCLIFSAFYGTKDMTKDISASHGGHLTISLTTTMWAKNYGHGNEMLGFTYVSHLEDICSGTAQPHESIRMEECTQWTQGNMGTQVYEGTES